MKLIQVKPADIFRLKLIDAERREINNQYFSILDEVKGRYGVEEGGWFTDGWETLEVPEPGDM